jgi:hypothetical protein
LLCRNDAKRKGFTTRTERRLSVGFVCDVARGLMYVKSRLKIGAPWAR